MKLTLTRGDYHLVMAALLAGIEYECSLAHAWDRADRKIAARYRRRMKSYRRVRTKLAAAA